jgi:hypothetical protein
MQEDYGRDRVNDLLKRLAKVVGFIFLATFFTLGLYLLFLVLGFDKTDALADSKYVFGCLVGLILARYLIWHEKIEGIPSE